MLIVLLGVGLVVSVGLNVLVLVNLIATRTKLLVSRAAHDELRSIQRTLERRLHDIELRERSLKAELTSYRRQDVEESPNISLDARSSPRPAPAPKPVTSKRAAVRPQAHTVTHHSTSRVVEDSGFSPVAAAMIGYAVGTSESGGSYSDSYNDACRSSYSDSYNDACSGSYSDSSYGGGGFDSGSCGGGD